jgi:type IV secretion system protein VirD4
VISDPPSFREIDMIAEAIIMQAAGENSWVTQGSQSIIAGLIDLVLKIKDRGQASLGDVRDLLTKTLAKSTPRKKSDDIDANAVSIEGADKLIRAMDAAGGIAQSAAAQLRAADDKERGIYFSDAINQTKWMNETAVRDSLSGNDFDFMALQRERCTVYLVLPPSETQRQARFLRLFINLAVLTALSKNQGIRAPDGSFLPRKKPVPVMYFLDEFYNLGPMQTLSSAAALIRSYGVKIFPILQNLGQLNEMYAKNWQTFKANSGVSIYFGVNDLETLNYLSERMGARVLWDKDQAGNIVAGRIVNMRTGEEIGRETGRESGRCFVHREGADPFILRRINYDEFYGRNQYNPDPDLEAETEEQTIFAKAWNWSVANVRRETGPL